MTTIPRDLVAARKQEALAHALGEVVIAALADPQVVEVMANPDGRLIVDRLDGGRRRLSATLCPQARERTIRLVADHVGEPTDALSPRISGQLPSGERFQGLLPPVSAGPAWSIRKRPARIWTLEDYQRQGVIDAGQVQILRQAAEARCNLLITGGTGSGKTALANALLAEPAFADDRVILIEDTPELQCSAWDFVPLLTRRGPARIEVVDLVRDALRLRPDRIVVGELRDGAAALEALKAWNTGHPGGLATLHANSADEAIARLEGLLGEVSTQPQHRLIDQAVEIIAHIRRTPDGRRLDPILVRRTAA